MYDNGFSFGPMAPNRNISFFPPISSIFMLKFRTPLCGLPGVYVTSTKEQQIFHLCSVCLVFTEIPPPELRLWKSSRELESSQKLSTLLPPS